MKLLITGATGLVGQALTRRLAGSPDIEAIAGSRRPGQDVVTPDLDADAPDWTNAVTGVDAAIHLAARLPWGGDDGDAAARPIFQRANVDASVALARALAQGGARRLVFVSSLGVHGVTSDTPFRPDSPIAPSGNYSWSKAEAERALRDVASETGLELVILRPPILYGPGVQGGFGKLTARIAAGKTPPLGGLTGNRRRMLAAENLADLLTVTATHPAATGRILLPGDDEIFSTASLTAALADAYGVPAPSRWPLAAPLRLAAHAPVIGPVAKRLIGDLTFEDDQPAEALGWRPPRVAQDVFAEMAAHDLQQPGA